MRHLFVGGPGRSGTSFVADRLGTHPQVAALKDIELKIFCEKNGLLDLRHALVETYSPNRALQGLDQFRRMTEALIDGRYGQPALTTVAPADQWGAAFAAFTNGFLAEGHPAPQTQESFHAAARALLDRIAAIAAAAADCDPDAAGALFLEKTPHNLLALRFLARLTPDARFLHVMRDPRSIAWSLLSMRWGPDELPAAARWVDSYCRAWLAAEAEAGRLGLGLTRLHIEDVAAAPGPAAAWLTAQLGLDAHPEMFRGADPEVLNRGAMKATADERIALDTRLGDWAVRFGYDPDRVGHRLCPAFADPADPTPATQPSGTAAG